MSKPRGRELAEAHIDWWWSSVRQLLIDNFEHGYKHGQDDAHCKPKESADGQPPPVPTTSERG